MSLDKKVRMKPLVTIITPTYNHQEFISDCLKSVKAQSYKNWEQIIVDDASSDNTIKIVSDYAKKDRRIRIISHQKRWGINRLAENYNQALKISRGKFVAILEGDDFWPEDKLSQQIKSADRPGVVLSFGDCLMTDKFGQPLKLYRYRQKKEFLENRPRGSILSLFASLNFFLVPCTVIIRKKALLAIGGFQKDSSYPFIDFPTFLPLGLEGEFSYQKEVLGYYRKQKDSAWFNFASKTPDMGWGQIQKCFDHFLTKNKFNPYLNYIIRQKEEIGQNQARFLRSKRRRKGLSLWLNRVAFGERNSLRILVQILFPLRYAWYKTEKKFNL